MRYIRFTAWILAALTMMVAVGSSIHSMFEYIFPLLHIDGNRAQAGGYTMEVVVSAVAFIMVLWRLLWALEVVDSIAEALNVLKTRTAVMSTALAGLIGMGFVNRFFWWNKHMFTNESFNSFDSYTGAANSAIISMILCVLVYSLHATGGNPVPENRKHSLPPGLPTGLILWLIGWITFWLGMLIYVSPH